MQGLPESGSREDLGADDPAQGSAGQGSGGAAQVRITRRAADRLRAGHLWVYRTEIESGEGAPGGLVDILDGRGVSLGSGLYSSSSTIAIRLLTRTPHLLRADWLRLLRERLRAALALRDQLAPWSEANTARRLVFSEADGLPGIVADQYGALVILQLLTQGTAQDDVREAIAAELRSDFTERGQPITVWERSDARIRELEQLPASPAEPLLNLGGPADGPQTATLFRLNGLAFHYDVRAGQKTGAFLDQRLNYEAAERAVLAAPVARGRALDMCTYQGGFALHLARVAARVTGVDGSRAALEVADCNLEANRSAMPAEVDWIEADAFELLRAFDDAGERFGTVVLDPPAFAKSKRAAESALRGYKELNLRALRMIESGGVLVTCSCSHHVSETDFRESVASAAADTGRAVQVLESRGAAPDHPELLALPETRYLKCLICRVR